ncbi:MAG: phosphoglycerate dehydrogenase [Burkholderiales bacterium]|nr:phosphoglycerate dehydrogenase [Burkholderiales bacterium]
MKIAFFYKSEEVKKILENRLLEHEIVFFEEKLTIENVNKVKDFEAISIFVDSEINKNIIDNLPNLKFIATRSTGFDHIDCEYASRKGIKVSNVPVYGSSTVAEFTFALLLNLSRKINEANKQLKEGGNFEIDPNLEGFDLDGKILGVIGTGKIGKNVIRIAKAFNMKVLAYDVCHDDVFAKENDFLYKTFEEVITNSDVITLHAPCTKDNHHLINKESILKMKRGVYIINTARGELIDLEALLFGIDEGIVGGVGLDVIEGERNFKKGDKLSLFNKKNVVITPHVAFYSREAVERIANTTIENIKAFISGNPTNLVK